MAYAERWACQVAGTSFADFKTFADTLEKRGVGALELLALELKSPGPTCAGPRVAALRVRALDLRPG